MTDSRQKIDIPRPAGKVLHRLHECGYEAYVVGGCVRDSVIGLIPDDWDITTTVRVWKSLHSGLTEIMQTTGIRTM